MRRRNGHVTSRLDQLPHVRRALVAVAIAVFGLTSACGGATSRDPSRAPRADAFRFVSTPYVVAGAATDAAGSHAYAVYFRLDRRLPSFGKTATSPVKALATVDGGDDGMSAMYPIPGAARPCYEQDIQGQAVKYPSPAATTIVLAHGPGQVARLALYIDTAAETPALQRDVKVTSRRPTDMVPATSGNSRYTPFPEGPYARALGCGGGIPGELTWREYERLRQAGRASR
jgi:hypothetical protein